MWNLGTARGILVGSRLGGKGACQGAVVDVAAPVAGVVVDVAAPVAGVVVVGSVDEGAAEVVGGSVVVVVTTTRWM